MKIIRKTTSYCPTCLEKIFPVRRKKVNRYSPELVETKKLYSLEAGQYSPKRHALHLQIVAHFIKKASSPNKGEKPIAVLIGGGTASGKTTLRKIIVENMLRGMNIHTVTVDPDEIKEYLPEYGALKKKHPHEAARLVHKESLDVSELLLSQLIRHRKHFVHEGTMARTNKYKKLVKQLKKAGYAVYAYIVDLPLETAKQRAAKRAKLTGRTIPPHIIENTHRLVPYTFLVIKQWVDNYYVYDNRHGLVLIASNHFVEPILYGEFLNKGKPGKKKENRFV